MNAQSAHVTPNSERTMLTLHVTLNAHSAHTVNYRTHTVLMLPISEHRQLHHDLSVVLLWKETGQRSNVSLDRK